MAEIRNTTAKRADSSHDAEFFKVFIPDSSSHRLLIPTDFVRDFKRMIKKRVTLKGISGQEWQVDVEQTPDGVFLTNGWPSFVGYHCLSAGEFLVFTVDNNYSFVVKVFGTDGCRKETPTAKKIPTPIKVEKVEEEFDEEQPPPKCPRTEPAES